MSRQAGSQGELIVYPCSGGGSIVVVNNFKNRFLWNQLAKQSQITCTRISGNMTKMASMPIYGKIL